MSEVKGFANVVFPARDLGAGVAAWTAMLGQEPAFVGDDFAVFSRDGLEVGLTALPWVDHPLVFWKVDDIEEPAAYSSPEGRPRWARPRRAHSPSSAPPRSRTATRRPASSTSRAAGSRSSEPRTGTSSGSPRKRASERALDPYARGGFDARLPQVRREGLGLDGAPSFGPM